MQFTWQSVWIFILKDKSLHLVSFVTKKRRKRHKISKNGKTLTQTQDTYSTNSTKRQIQVSSQVLVCARSKVFGTSSLQSSPWTLMEQTTPEPRRWAQTPWSCWKQKGKLLGVEGSTSPRVLWPHISTVWASPYPHLTFVSPARSEQIPCWFSSILHLPWTHLLLVWITAEVSGNQGSKDVQVKQNKLYKNLERSSSKKSLKYFWAEEIKHLHQVWV